MFAVIYHWKLKNGISPEAFEKIWNEGTLKIYRERGSLGSSLHRLDDGTYIAYARWPNKAMWQKMINETAKTSINKPYVDSIDEPITLDVVDDLLKSGPYSL